MFGMWKFFLIFLKIKRCLYFYNLLVILCSEIYEKLEIYYLLFFSAKECNFYYNNKIEISLSIKEDLTTLKITVTVQWLTTIKD